MFPEGLEDTPFNSESFGTYFGIPNICMYPYFDITGARSPSCTVAIAHTYKGVSGGWTGWAIAHAHPDYGKLTKV